MAEWKARLTGAQREELVMILAKMKQAKIGVSQDGANLRVTFPGQQSFDVKGNVDVYSLAERVGIDITSLDPSYTKLGAIEQVTLKSKVASIFTAAAAESINGANVASYSLHLAKALEANGIQMDFEPNTATALAFILAQPRHEKLLDILNQTRYHKQAQSDIIHGLLEDLDAIGVRFKTSHSPTRAAVDEAKLTQSGAESIFNEPDKIRDYALKLANEATQPIGLIMKFHRTCIQRNLSVALNGEPTLPQEFMSPSIRNGLVSVFHNVKAGNLDGANAFLSGLRYVDDSGRGYSQAFETALEDKLRLRKGVFVSQLAMRLASQKHISPSEAEVVTSKVESLFKDTAYNSEVSLYIAVDALRESSRLLGSPFVTQPYESMLNGIEQFSMLVKAPYKIKPAPAPQQKPAQEPEAVKAPALEDPQSKDNVDVVAEQKEALPPETSKSSPELDESVASKALEAFKGELIDKCFRGDEVELPDVMDWVEKRWRDVIDSMEGVTPEEKLNFAQVEFHGLNQSRNFRKSQAWYEQSVERHEMSTEVNKDITKILEAFQTVNADDPKLSEAMSMCQGALLENMMPVLGSNGTIHPLAELPRLESARNGIREGLLPIAKSLSGGDTEPLLKYAELLTKRSDVLNQWKENAPSPEQDNALAHHWNAIFPDDKALPASELEKGVDKALELISDPEMVSAMLDKPVEENTGSLSMIWDKEQLIGTTESSKPKAYEEPDIKAVGDFFPSEEAPDDTMRPSIKH